VTSVTVSDDNPFYSSLDGKLLFDRNQTDLLACVPSAKAIELPESVVQIEDDAFAGCIALRAVSMLGDAPVANDDVFAGTPADLVVYGDAVDHEWGDPARLSLEGWKGREFRDVGLQDPEGVQSVTDGAGVRWNYSVDGHRITVESVSKNVGGAVTLPDTLSVAGVGELPVTAIARSAFADCSGITSISIPTGVVSIASDAFNGCTSLDSFTVADANPAYSSDPTTGALYSKDGSTLVKVPATFRFRTVFTIAESTVAQTYLKTISLTNDHGLLKTKDYSIETVGSPVKSGDVWTLTFVPDADEADLLAGVSVIGDCAFCDCGTLPAGTVAAGTLVDGRTGKVSSSPVTLPIGTDSESVSSSSSKTTACTYPDPKNILLQQLTIVTTVASTNYASSVPFPSIPASVGYTKQSFYGSPWYELVEADRLPALKSTATAADVKKALVGAADKRLASNVTDVETYDDFRTWAAAVTDGSGRPLGQSKVMNSDGVWAAYALGLDRLPAEAIDEDDFQVEEFKRDGVAEYRVRFSARDFDIGKNASEANLRRLITVEGATSFEPGAFSSDAVTLKFQSVSDGSLPLTIRPSRPVRDSFFISIKLNLD